jgi:hypothetical protein
MDKLDGLDVIEGVLVDFTLFLDEVVDVDEIYLFGFRDEVRMLIFFKGFGTKDVVFVQIFYLNFILFGIIKCG